MHLANKITKAVACCDQMVGWDAQKQAKPFIFYCTRQPSPLPETAFFSAVTLPKKRRRKKTLLSPLTQQRSLRENEPRRDFPRCIRARKSWIWSQELGAQTPWQAGGAGWGMCCWFHSVTDALQLHRSTQIPQSLISTHSTCWQQVLHRDCWRRQPHLSVYYSFVMFAVNKGRRRQHFQNKSLLKLFVCVFWMCNYESILRHQGMKFQYGFRKQAPYKRGSSEHRG